MDDRTKPRNLMLTLVPLLFASLLLVVPQQTRAHCDTLDGPVITEARTALEKGDVTPVFKWVQEGDEPEVRRAFVKALAVRQKGPEAKELADTYFFETLVRIHRAGEGAPYIGIAPAGVVEPVKEADNALETGSIDALAKELSELVESGVRTRFARALAAKKHASESVPAGREFVEAYVQYVHYVEGLHQMAAGSGLHHEHAALKEEQHETRVPHEKPTEHMH